MTDSDAGTDAEEAFVRFTEATPTTAELLSADMNPRTAQEIGEIADEAPWRWSKSTTFTNGDRLSMMDPEPVVEAICDVCKTPLGRHRKADWACPVPGQNGRTEGLNPDQTLIPTPSFDDMGATVDVSAILAVANGKVPATTDTEDAVGAAVAMVYDAKRELATRTSPWERTGNWERKFELLHGRYRTMVPLMESMAHALDSGVVDAMTSLHMQLEAARSAGDRRQAGAINAMESQRDVAQQRARTIQTLTTEVHSVQRDLNQAENELRSTRTTHAALIKELAQQHEAELEALRRGSWLYRLFHWKASA